MRPAEVARNLLSGVVVGLVTIAYCLSFGALIFSGPFADGLGYGITAVLIAAIIGAVVVARLSSIPIAVAGPDTPPVAVMAAMAFSLGGTITATGEVAAGTLLLALVLTTMMAGLGLFLIGWCGLATWMRFIPYPVIAGFLAASGWFLTEGAFRVATGVEFGLENWDAILADRTVPLWATSLAFAGLLLLVRRLWPSPFAVPVTLFAALAAAVSLVEFGDVPADVARAQGWLMAVPVSSTAELPWTLLSAGPWQIGALLPHLPEMLAVALVAAMAILLNATGIEVSERLNADLDAEMRAAGLANLTIATLGGIVANLTFNRSRLNLSAGATNRLSAAVCGLLCLLFLLGGKAVIGYVSAPILAGLLFFLGLSSLWNWVVGRSRQLDWTDFALILAIFLLIVRFGYLAGAALGIVASCLFFALTYSRIPFIRRELSRQSYASTVERSQDHSRILREQGDRIRILKLQGYIFFGTASRLVEHIQKLTVPGPGLRIDRIIVDFESVTGIDSSARFSFIRLFQIAETRGFRIVLVSRPGEIREVFRSERLLIEEGPDRNVFETLDLALEHGEEALLRDLGQDRENGARLIPWLARELGGEEIAESLIGYMRRRECHAGDMLYRQGEDADRFCFVGTGRVSILLERPPLEPVRLRSTVGQTILGEMGFYRRDKRSASVRVEEPGVIYELDRKAFEAMVEEAPAVAQALNVFIIRTLADRLSFASDEVAALQR